MTEKQIARMPAWRVGEEIRKRLKVKNERWNPAIWPACCLKLAEIMTKRGEMLAIDRDKRGMYAVDIMSWNRRGYTITSTCRKLPDAICRACLMALVEDED